MSLVADRVLDLAVQRVKRNCRIALDTRGSFSLDTAMDLLRPVNEEALYVGLSSAQLILDAEGEKNPPARPRIPNPRTPRDN